MATLSGLIFFAAVGFIIYAVVKYNAKNKQRAKKAFTWGFVLLIASPVVAGIGNYITGSPVASDPVSSPPAKTDSSLATSPPKAHHQSTQPKHSVNSTLKPKVLTIDQWVPDGNYKVRFNGVKVDASVGDVADGLGETAKGIYYIVNVTMANTNNTANTLDSSLFTIIDANGNKYSADTTATMDLNSGTGFFLDQLNPGESETGDIAFDVPKGLKHIKLHVDGGFISLSSVDFPLPNAPSF